MTDNDDTPPIRQLTDEERMSHFDDFPPGTPPVEHRLDARLARAEREVDTLRGEVASLTASRDTGRKLMWLVIPALVGGLITVLLFSADKIATSSERAGETRAQIQALSNLIDWLKLEVVDLRKHAGLDRPVSDGRIGANP